MTPLDDFLTGVLRDVTDPPVTITIRGEPYTCGCGSKHFTAVDGFNDVYECRACLSAYQGDPRPMSCLCGGNEFTVTADLTWQCRDCTRVWEGA